MSLTPSNMIPLGTKAPEFSLPNVVTGNSTDLKEVAKEKGLVVAFICNHCPYVIHIQECFISLAREYMEKGIGFVAISSNDVESHPLDHPDKMKELAISNDFPFDYLYDESQEVAKAYDAACTPDLYLFDGNLELVYRGQLDDSRPGNQKEVSGKDLRAAMDALLNERPVLEKQIPASGCNIKWKA